MATKSKSVGRKPAGLTDERPRVRLPEQVYAHYKAESEREGQALSEVYKRALVIHAKRGPIPEMKDDVEKFYRARAEAMGMTFSQACQIALNSFARRAMAANAARAAEKSMGDETMNLLMKDET